MSPVVGTAALHRQLLWIDWNQLPFLFVRSLPLLDNNSRSRCLVCFHCRQRLLGFGIGDLIRAIRQLRELPSWALIAILGERHLGYWLLCPISCASSGKRLGCKMVLQLEARFSDWVEFPGHTFPGLCGVQNDASPVGAVWPLPGVRDFQTSDSGSGRTPAPKVSQGENWFAR